MNKFRHRFAITLSLTLFFIATPAGARTWRVNVSQSGDAPTILAAIDSAQAGDEILVAPGTYTWTSENAADHSMIVMKRDVVLLSEAGPESTILNAENTGRVLLFRDTGGASVDGFTIQNGFALPQGGGFIGLGGGIFSFGDSRPTISNCIVRNNHAVGGGGIVCNAGGAIITNCQILENDTGETAGGGMVCQNAIISNCTIRDNFAFGSVGGLWAFACTVTDCLIEGNLSVNLGSSGGGAVGLGGTLFTRCSFIGNTASGAQGNASGGGLAVEGPCTVEDCIFVGNSVSASRDAYGGAIGGGSRAQLTVRNCTMVGNSAGGGLAEVGGIYVNSSASGSVSTSIIAWSIGTATHSPTVEYSCNDIFGNTGGDVLQGIDAGGNFSADPQFCAVDPVTSLNFAIQQDSPCAPGNHPMGQACSLVGAVPVGCGSVAVKQTTWSALKSLYRQRSALRNE